MQTRSKCFGILDSDLNDQIVSLQIWFWTDISYSDLTDHILNRSYSDLSDNILTWMIRFWLERSDSGLIDQILTFKDPIWPLKIRFWPLKIRFWPEWSDYAFKIRFWPEKIRFWPQRSDFDLKIKLPVRAKFRVSCRQIIVKPEVIKLLSVHSFVLIKA